ncbi:MAG: hypothetical protein AB7V46_01895 [Thermomicrobiales bacterium]
MPGWKFVLVWAVCVVLGALIGYGIGWALWKAGLELVGSAVALVGAAVGGFVILYFFMKWTENRQYR